MKHFDSHMSLQESRKMWDNRLSEWLHEKGLSKEEWTMQSRRHLTPDVVDYNSNGEVIFRPRNSSPWNYRKEEEHLRRVLLTSQKDHKGKGVINKKTRAEGLGLTMHFIDSMSHLVDPATLNSVRSGEDNAITEALS